MSSELKKPLKHKRWTQKSANKEAHFPKQKYHFSTHLTHVGDWVQTNPISHEEYIKLKDAAKFWAWNHGVRVAVRMSKTSDDKRIVTITLVSYTRKKEDSTVYDIYQMLTNVNEDSQ